MHNKPMMLNGIPVYVSVYAQSTESEQFKFPRSKRKRIRKKFKKLYSMNVLKPACYKVPQGIIIHPELYNKLPKSKEYRKY